MDEVVSGASPGRAELETLAEIGRSILLARPDEDTLCELIFKLARRIVPADFFQIGLFEADDYLIKVWLRDGERLPPARFPLTGGQGIVGWVRSSGQPLLVRDFVAEAEHLPAQPSYASGDPPRSALFIPMLAEEAAIGAMVVQSQVPGAFDEDDLRLLSILANQSASALYNARLYSHSERRLNALLAVSEVGRRLASILDLDELLTQVVTLIGSRFNYYHAQIYLVEKGSRHARFRASDDPRLNKAWHDAPGSGSGFDPRIGREGIIGWVAQHGTPLLANDVSAEPRYIPDDPRLLPDTRAELAVPIRIEDEVLGVLDVQSDQGDAFSADDVFILQTLADQVAVAVNSARAFEAQRVEAWITNVILQVAEATAQAEGFHEVVASALRVTAMLAGVESAAIWLWDDEEALFRFAGASAGGAECFKCGDAAELRSQAWLALDAVRLRRAPVTIDAGLVPLPIRSSYAGQTVALLPMFNKGDVIGVLVTGLGPDGPEDLGERRLAMLGGIAHQIAAAIENTRLAAHSEEEAWISTLLLQVGEAIRRLQPVDLTLTQVTRLGPALTGVERCAALLRDIDGTYRVRTVHGSISGFEPITPGQPVLPGELPLLDDALRIGQPLVANNTSNSEGVPDNWRARYGSRTLLVVPLLVADEPVGALIADDGDASHLFSPRRVRILAGMANQAAIAIENARLQLQEAASARIGRELELARDIQNSLLPRSAPQVEGYQIAHRWSAASEVGGDFFDFMPLQDGALGLIVADVSDKGIPAALYMMFARTLMRAVAFSGREPAAMLERANELILADSTTDMFVTAYYAALRRESHCLTYASAGHNLALLCRSGEGTAEPLTTGGIALGIIDGVPFEEKTVELRPGDVVLFYTDGALDQLSPAGEPFGEERLQATLLQEREGSASTILDAIEAALAAHAGDTARNDDVTFVALKREVDGDH